jgi:hypothetical protein
MVASAGYYKLKENKKSSLDLDVVSRLSLGWEKINKWKEISVK